MIKEAGRGRWLVRRIVSAVGPGSIGSEMRPVLPRSVFELVSTQGSPVRLIVKASDCSKVRSSVSAVSVSRAHNPASDGAPPTAIRHFALSFATWLVREYVLIERDGLAPHTPSAYDLSPG